MFFLWILWKLGLLNRAPTSIQLHPPTPSSTQLHPPTPSSFQPPSSYTHLHPAHFSFHPAFCKHPQQYLNQNIGRNWEISPNLGRKIKSCPFWLKIGTHGYFGAVDSESRLRFLKFRPQNPFLGKFGPKNSKLSVLSENWCT